ncbi:MAG: PhoU domain-containing protein [Thermoplasmatales archaeon]
MEIRKIQKTGGSTLVVSLPKAWCQNFNLKVGSKVSLNYSDSGAIILEPFEKGKEDKEPATIEVTSNSVENSLRLMLSKYIRGYKEITVKSDSKSSLSYVIKNFLDLTVGFEVVVENERMAVLEDIVSLPTLTFDKAIRRIDTLVRSLVKESVSRNKIPGDYIISKDTEVDKFNLYIQRLYNESLKNYNILQMNKIRMEEALSYLLFSRIMERVADHATRIYIIAKPELLDENIEVMKYVNDAIEIFEKSVETYFKKNVEEANDLISRKEFIKRQRDILKEQIKNSSHAVDLEEILEDIERIALYGTDICELTIDYN